MEELEHEREPEEGELCRPPLRSLVPCRRPLLGLTTAFVVGTGLGLTQSVPASFPLLTAGVAAGLCLLCLVCTPLSGARRGSRALAAAASGLLLLGVLFAAWAAACLHPMTPSDDAWVRERDRLDRGVEVEGIVVGDPGVGAPIGRKARRTEFPVAVERVRCEGGTWEPVRGRLVVSWYGPLGQPAISYGERHVFSGRIRPYVRHGVRMRGYSIASGLGSSDFLASGQGRWFLDFCFSARRTAARYLSIGISDFPDVVGLLNALLLGERSHLPSETRRLFVDTGTLHIFAISGLHVGMVAGLIIFALTSLRVSRIYWVLFLAPLVLAYVVATGAKASAIRACVMAVIYFMAPLFGRKADSLSSLALAALVILVLDPLQLAAAGFIFSFVVVTGLIVLYPVIRPWLAGWYAPDALRVQEETRWIQNFRSWGGGLSSLATLSLSTWLVSTPLTAYFFGRICPVALLGNILVIPVAFLVVLAGCLSLTLGACATVFSDVFNHANLALIWLLVRGADGMCRIPFGSLVVAKPPLWIVVSWYGLLAAGLLVLRQRKLVAHELAAAQFAEGADVETEG